MVVKMEQKELNNLSAEELDAMADALLAADDAKQAETKAAPAADEPAEDKPVAEKPESEKTCSKPRAVSSHGIYETPVRQASSMISVHSKRIREPPCGMPCSRGRISASSAP